jgi:hypothetical protein
MRIVDTELPGLDRQFVMASSSSTYSRGRYPLGVLLEELQWLDAATLDMAVDMKVNFYAPHLKGWP